MGIRTGSRVVSNLSEDVTLCVTQVLVTRVMMHVNVSICKCHVNQWRKFVRRTCSGRCRELLQKTPQTLAFIRTEQQLDGTKITKQLESVA